MRKVVRRMDPSHVVTNTSQRSVTQPSDSSRDSPHPLISSPTHVWTNCTDTHSGHTNQRSADLLNTAAGCFLAQDYSGVVQLLEQASPGEQSSTPDVASLLGCALAYYKLGDYQTSAARFRVLESMDSPSADACGARFLACLYLGDIHSIEGDYLGAVSYYGKATSCYTSSPPPSSVAAAYCPQTPSLSSLYLKQGANLRKASKIMAAIEAYRNAIKTAVHNRKDRLAAYTGLGTLHHALGDHTSAVQQYTEALGLAEEEGDLVSLGHAHGNIGNAYVGLHQRDKALFHLVKSLDLTLENDPVPQAIGRAYNNLGTAYQSLGELDRAEEYYQLALGQCIYGKDPAGQARAYGNLGNVAMLKKDHDAAIASFTETLQISNDSAILIAAHHNRGCCLSEKARKMTSGAIDDTNRITFHGPSVACDQRLLSEPVRSLYSEALGDLKDVIKSHEDTLHSIKGSGEGLGLSVSLAESSSRTFHHMQDCLCALGRTSDALVYAEQSRARSLGELLLRKKGAQFGRLFSPPLSSGDISCIVLEQSVDVVYLSYTGASLLVWVLSPLRGRVVENMIEVRLDGVLFNGSTLEVFLHNTMSELIAENSLEMFEFCDYSSPSPLLPLGSILVQPLLKVLMAVHLGRLPSEIVLVPDSHTLIPFAALLHPDRSGFLGDRLRFRVMPSLLTMGLMCHAPSTQQSLTRVTIPLDSPNFCIVGDPAIPPFRHNGEDWKLGRLPHARKEAGWVAHILGSHALLEEEATKVKVCRKLVEAKLIHIATHGGRVSGFLALAGTQCGSGDCPTEGTDVLLLPSEVEKLTIRAAMVVLSSCDSGRGMVRADGIIGMGRAFLLAGAQSVLTTLWRIPDESAGMFMQFFYQYLVDGLGTTHALQKATLSVRCFKKYSSYSHWGGFQLIGRDVQFVVERTSEDIMLRTRLGGGSAFPRLDLLNKMEDALVLCTAGRASDVQILHSCSGLVPEEPVIDFIIKHHTHFGGGIFWVNGSSEHLLQGSVSILSATMPQPQHLQETLPLAPPTNPLVPPTSPLLIVLDNLCTDVMPEAMLSVLASCHTHIIVITTSPEAMQEEARTRLHRGSCVHRVEPLSPLQATQRLVYALQSKVHLVPLNSDQELLARVVGVSHGSPELVDAFSSLLLQRGTRNKRDTEPMDEIALPSEDVLCGDSGDWLAQVSHSLLGGFNSSPAYLSPEEQLVLSSLLLFGESPIPEVVVDAVQEIVGQASPRGSCPSLVEGLRQRHLIRQYPSPCVVKPSTAAAVCGGGGGCAFLLRVPQLIADALWSALDEGGRVMAVAMAHKALRNACQRVPREDNYAWAVCSGMGVALAEAAGGVAGLTEDCYHLLYQPVSREDVMISS